jgi:hypothetical protein
MTPSLHSRVNSAKNLIKGKRFVVKVNNYAAEGSRGMDQGTAQ